jgi:uncharacterized iron-regulated membrane protein
MAVSTRALLRLHRYVGLFAAPVVIFFSLSGIWQVYRLQETRKDGSYTAPRVLSEASLVHKVERLEKGPAASAFKLVVSSTAALIAFSTILGIIAGARTTRSKWLVVCLLATGTAVPLALYLMAH